MRVADLFSGCGGLSLGLENAGFEVAVAVEHWAAARKAYALNFDHPIIDLDIAGVNNVVDHLRPFDIDMIAGGPPCQDFSAAGGRSEGVRAELTVSFAQVIANLRPTWFLLENVPQAAKSAAWGKARRVLSRAGYGMSECTLEASFYDVPQNRKRLFVIGRLSEDDHFLDERLAERPRDARMTIREHIGDTLGVDFYYRHPRNWGRKAVFSIDEPSPTIRSTNRRVPPGYTAHETDAGDYRLARPLTPAERALIQTFPSTFVFAGTTTEQDMMVANAVPVNLAKWIGEVIMSYENQRHPEAPDLRFRTWLVEHRGLTDRSAGNIVSRVKRVSKILRANFPPAEVDATLAALKKRSTYRILSTSVRSQLKRAVVLHAEFKAYQLDLGLLKKPVERLEDQGAAPAENMQGSTPEGIASIGHQKGRSAAQFNELEPA